MTRNRPANDWTRTKAGHGRPRKRIGVATVGDEQEIDLKALVGGDKRAWDGFCRLYAPAIHGAVRRAFAGGRPSPDDVLDASQEVFVRLCRDDYRLLREFDPGRAKLSTWLGVIAYSAAVDWLRRRRPGLSLEDVPEAALSVQQPSHERLMIPPDLLTERQALVVKLLYEREMEVADVAKMLQVDAQTVRSTHHKALLRLREHFKAPKRAVGSGDEPPPGTV
jgi:RNA polymerase sigma-70 factor (ECF subfamily)